MRVIDPKQLESIRVSEGDIERQMVEAAVSLEAKTRAQFIKVPMVWFDRLEGAGGATYRVALYVLHLHWKSRGQAFKVPNVGLTAHSSKWRALEDLEERGLIRIERCKGKAPMVRVVATI